MLRAQVILHPTKDATRQGTRRVKGHNTLQATSRGPNITSKCRVIGSMGPGGLPLAFFTLMDEDEPLKQTGQEKAN